MNTNPNDPTVVHSLISALYPNEDLTSDWLCICDYQPILNSFGPIILQVDDDDYQGDSRVLYRDPNGRIGFLMFGWGSCSGCDALQACNTVNDVYDLYIHLRDSVVWFPSSVEAFEWFSTHDWSGDFSYNDSETPVFVERAKELLDPLT